MGFFPKSIIYNIIKSFLNKLTFYCVYCVWTWRCDAFRDNFSRHISIARQFPANLRPWKTIRKQDADPCSSTRSETRNLNNLKEMERFRPQRMLTRVCKYETIIGLDFQRVHKLSYVFATRLVTQSESDKKWPSCLRSFHLKCCN